jgi:nitrogen fixation NifU-like protein
MNDAWKDLYKKPQETDVQHTGPLLFYTELVIDHANHPRNVGELEDADGEVILGDPECGDQIKIGIKICDNRITDIKFKSNGCAGAIATNSMMTELAKGKTIEEALQLTDDDVIIALGGIPERKKNCSLMGVTGLRNAIEDCYKKGRLRPENTREESVA